jgi:nucleoside-diphosphate-sugar epimerase
MKILIIGGKSSLGSELKLFLKSSFQVYTAGRYDCDIYLDLSRNCDLDVDFKCDVVVLTAAVFGGRDFNAFEENIIVNVLGTARSIKIASNFGAKHFILISSMSIFLDHISPKYEIYSITKKQSEEVAEFVSSSINLPLTILRPSQLYGENEMFKKHQPLLYEIIEKVEMNKDVIFHGKKNSIRNYLHVKDFNEIVRKVIDLKVFGKYSCVNTTSTTLIETFNAAINAFKSSSIYKFDNSKDDIIENIFQADVDFFNKIDFEPQIDIITGMEMIANSRRVNYID